MRGVPTVDGAAGEDEEAASERAPQGGAPEAEGEMEERNARDSILRPDFGEAARLSPPGSSTLHHVEELRSRPEEIPRGATGEDGTKDEVEPPQDRHKSA